jgi:hypothetical protein
MTKIFQAVLASFFLVLLTAFSAEAKAWRGIVPLQSTRKDVESVLGVSADPCSCIYKTNSEVVMIEYARQPCSENPNGWNVPVDTVVKINVSPKEPPRFSALGIDPLTYKRTKDLHTPAVYYSNDEEGVMYQVSEAGTVEMAVYQPSASDAMLRCGEAGLAGGERFTPIFDQYGDIAFNDEKARLDNFAAQLKHFSEHVGYIVFYRASRQSSAKVLNRARRARRYLVEVRGVKASRIFVVDGGRKDAFATELYILPKTTAALRLEATDPTGEPGFMKVDQYGFVSVDAEVPRLDEFAETLKGWVGARAYIIVYPGGSAGVDEAKKRASFSHSYLVNNRRVDAGRVVTLIGGNREEPSIELFIVVKNGIPPEPLPKRTPELP